MLDLTYSSVLTTIIDCNLIFIVIYLAMRRTSTIIQIGYRTIVVTILLTVFRLILPIELLPISHNMYFPEGLSKYIIQLGYSFGSSNITLSQLLGIIWFIGILVKLIYFIADMRRYKRVILSEARNISGEKQIEELVGKYKKQRPWKLQVLESKYVSSPLIFGLYYQKILLPEKSKYDSVDLEYILHHEILHYNNGDLVLKFVVSIINCFFWWNPALFMIRNELNTILEIRVDHMITDNGENAVEYMNSLLHAMKEEVHENKVPIMAFSSKKSVMKKRFEYIMYKKKNGFAKHICRLAVIFFLCVSYLFTLEPYYDDPTMGADEGAITLTRENAYLIQKRDGSYDIYYEDELLGNTTELDEVLRRLKIVNK